MSDPADLPDMSESYRRYLASVVAFHLTAASASGLGPTDYQASSLLDLDGPMTTGQIAKHLALSPAAATRVVDRLVHRGLARRIADPRDRRRVVVEHTGQLPDGLGEILASVRGPIGQAVSELSETQAEGLLQYFRAAEHVYNEAARDIAQA